ncbi:hypothetical protein F5880DRAFT_1090702 [Lentinula raphanica]|nr:hypothetical protein F5880DRAFT_1090702 [Lentinula raphanica]
MSSRKLQLADYSSFAHLLENGGVFDSSAQRKELEDTIEKSTGHDIPALEDEIRELKVTKTSIQATVSKFEQLLTPNAVNRLPTEILTEIFLNVRDTATGYTTTITEGLWPISHVSRKWRNVAISMPQLWSNISIGVIETPAKNELQLLNTALARSGSHPLHVNASFSWSTSEELGFQIWETGARSGRPSVKTLIPLWPTEEQLSRALIQTIVQHSNRWKTASIDVLDSYYFHPIHCQLSSLEKLTYSGKLEFRSVLFSVAPKLREVEFSGTDSGMYQLPWTQLVRFHESQIPDELPADDLVFHYVEILRQCDQLEDFGAVCVCVDEGLGPHPSLVHNNLKTFRCSDFHLVRCLTLPSLQNLHLQPVPLDSSPLELIPSAHELLTRSRCASSLRVLRLTAVVLDHSIFDLLESTEGLRELHFAFDNRDIPEINAFMTRLITRLNTSLQFAKPSDQVFLPHLEEFTSDIEAITGYESPTFNIQFIDETYVDMVEGRWNSSGDGVSQLRVVKFESHVPATLSGFTDRCIQRMKEMRDEGLTAYIAASMSKDRRETPKIYVK